MEAARAGWAAQQLLEPDIDILEICAQLLEGDDRVLDAQRSYDPDGSDSQLWVEWDLDGDKVFDTPPSNTKTFTTTYRAPGVYQVIAKLTDGEGAVSQSIPIGIRIAR